VFDAEGCNSLDASGVEALEQLLTALGASGVTLVMARMKAPLQEQFAVTGLTDRIGREHCFDTVERAVAWCDDHRRDAHRSEEAQ
jgi:MFS superfamily sulfate permease-like transporter